MQVAASRVVQQHCFAPLPGVGEIVNVIVESTNANIQHRHSLIASGRNGNACSLSVPVGFFPAEG
jgi:hypothetical protein